MDNNNDIVENDDNLNLQQNNNSDDTNILQEDVETLKKTYEEEVLKLQDSYTRLLAELVNTRKNLDLDKTKAKQSLLLKIISIVDTYSLISQNENASEPLQHILQELNTLLETESIKKIDIKAGEKFDPTISEVISTQQGEEDGIVIAVVSPAYELRGQIIKTAKVIVSKK